MSNEFFLMNCSPQGDHLQVTQEMVDSQYKITYRTMTLQDYHDSNEYEVTNEGIQKKPLNKRSLKKEDGNVRFLGTKPFTQDITEACPLMHSHLGNKEHPIEAPFDCTVIAYVVGGGKG